MTDNRSKNRALVRHLLLPTVFLTAALLGGLRVEAGTGALLFIAPPLVALVLATMLMVLFVRGGALSIGRWLAGEHHPLTNAAHALVLGALFFASAQSFNSVLPEAGLLRWMFSFFFLWTLWNDLFSPFDARRLLRSLAVLFATAFALKHMLLASLYAPGEGLLRRLAGALLEGVTLGTIDGQSFAPATGYISFFTLVLYVGGLALLPPAPDEEADGEARVREFVSAYRRLPPGERSSVRGELLKKAEQPGVTDESQAALPQSVEGTFEPVEDDDENTLIRKD